MSFIPSLLCYNFLEAFLLLLACYLFRNNKYKNVKLSIKKFVIHSYIFGAISLLFQYPMNFIANPLLYMIYNILIGVFLTSILLCVYANKYIVKSSIFKCFAIQTLYMISIDVIIVCCDFKFIIDYDLNTEFCINIFMKLIQYFILLGGYLMKKFLINIAKKSVGNNIASTTHGYGEPELHESLKQEITK